MKEEFMGSCILEIRIKDHGEYLKFCKYTGTRQWDFVVIYPAIMRSEFKFKTSLDVEVMSKRIVQLLQMGFDVYSCRWRLKKTETEENNHDNS